MAATEAPTEQNGAARPVRILIADDHHVVRDALSMLVQRLARQVVVDHASTLPETLAVAQANCPDLVLLDLCMPGMNELEGLDTVLAQCPTSRIVVMSGWIDPCPIEQSLRRGAAGYIPKTMLSSVIIHALQLVLAGERFIPSNLLIDTAAIEPAPARDAARRTDAVTLTERQLAVVRELADGASNKEIARRLGIAEITVKVHLQAIYRVLGTDNRTSTVRKVLELGLLPEAAPEPAGAAGAVRHTPPELAVRPAAAS